MGFAVKRVLTEGKSLETSDPKVAEFQSHQK